MKFIISLLSFYSFSSPVVIKYKDFEDAKKVKVIINHHFNFPDHFIALKREKCSKKLGQFEILEICIRNKIKILANKRMLNKNYKIFRELK